MESATTISDVLEASSGHSDERKLAKLKASILSAVGKPLDKIEFAEPMLIRRSLIRYWKEQGVSPGTIQAMEQFFMGVIRRAAVKGIVVAPPEGPWTRLWQTVIDCAGETNTAKALARSLAAWSTERELQPNTVDAAIIRQWATSTSRAIADFETVSAILSAWQTKQGSSSTTLHHLNERLRSKAHRGSVFADRR